MNKKENKIVGFDFIRTFAIFFVFMAHILSRQSHNEIVLLIGRSISPGLTMSVLGFISGYLLTSQYNTFNGSFYVKRFSRIYSSLISCLSVITILHLILLYNVINQHSIIHFMGLSFFMELFKVTNESSLGGGLWFITIINLMYLLLPLMCQLYTHKYNKIHLLIIIVLCLFFHRVMYGTASAWNVVIAFNIGCYVGLNSSIEMFTKKSLFFYLSATIMLLLLSGLATSRTIPHEVRILLFPFYPLFVIPLLFKVGNRIKGGFKAVVTWLSSISYEVYILHFYFINKNFSDLFPTINTIYFQILISIIIVVPLAYINSQIGLYISNAVNNYLLLQRMNRPSLSGLSTPS